MRQINWPSFELFFNNLMFSLHFFKTILTRFSIPYLKCLDANSYLNNSGFGESRGIMSILQIGANLKMNDTLHPQKLKDFFNTVFLMHLCGLWRWGSTMVHKNLEFGIFKFQVRYTQKYPLKMVLTLESASIALLNIL